MGCEKGSGGKGCSAVNIKERNCSWSLTWSFLLGSCSEWERSLGGEADLEHCTRGKVDLSCGDKSKESDSRQTVQGGREKSTRVLERGGEEEREEVLS